MSKNYTKTAQEVLRKVGGESNVTHLEHCSTRLRFSIANSALVDKDGLKATQGVIGVIANGSQCQVVIGMEVVEVYNELIKLGSFEGGGQVPDDKLDGRKDFAASALDFVVGVFRPLIPPIAGAGILKAVLTILTTCGILSSDATLYKIFLYASDAAIYYLPLMVAYTTASKLQVNRLIALAVVGALVYPNTLSLISSEGGAYLLGFRIQNIAYANQVFPAILTVIFMSFVEKFFNKVSPKSIRIFFVPMMCMMITFPVSLCILGPLGYNLGVLLTTFILALYNTLGWLAVGLVSAILPFMIALGMHKALVPYAISSITSPGFDMLYIPASIIHNMTEGGACAAVALRTKNADLRATAISSSISSIFGIVEPSLYGVTMQRKRVVISVCISSFLGGIFMGLTRVKAFAAVVGLASLPIYIDPDNGMNLIWACAGVVLSIVLSFVITLILYKDEEPA